MDINVLGSSSKGNCYVVSDGVTTVLLDCGIAKQKIMQGIHFEPQNVAGCLITHSHKDHILSANSLAELGINIYASAEEFAAAGVNCIECNSITGGKAFSVGTFKVLPFDVNHDTPKPLGFLLQSNKTKERLLYFTDTYYIKYRFLHLTHILCECNYDRQILAENAELGRVGKALEKRLLSSHMSIDHLEQMLKANDLSSVKQIYLCHLSDNNSNADAFKDRIQRLTGAEVIIC